jgi:hypothetical protein
VKILNEDEAANAPETSVNRANCDRGAFAQRRESRIKIVLNQRIARGSAREKKSQ